MWRLYTPPTETTMHRRGNKRKALGAVLVAIVGMIPGCALNARGTGRPNAVPVPVETGPPSRLEAYAEILRLEDRRELGGGTLSQLLKSPEAAIRRRAALAIGRIGDPLGLGHLLPLMDDSEPLVRRAAAFALGLLKQKEASATLVRALKDSDPSVRGRASEALSRLGASETAGLIAEAARRAIPGGGPVLVVRGDAPGDPEDPWVELRLHLFALARLKATNEAASVLVNADGTARLDWWASAWTAMRLEDERLAPLLEAAAKSTDAASRAIAARGLGALRKPAYAPTIIRLCEDEDEGVLIQALRALPLAQDPAGIGAALRKVDSTSPVIRREALLALSGLPKDSRGRSRIVEALGDPNAWIRAAAWQAVAKIDGEGIGLLMATSSADDDWRVRAALAEAVGENAGAGAPILLTSLLGDSDLRVVSSALSALSRALGSEAHETLLPYLKNPDMGIRATAIQALAKDPTTVKAEAWVQAWYQCAGDTDVETQVTLIDVLGKVAQRNDGAPARALLGQIAAAEFPRVVRQRALDALGSGFASGEKASHLAADAAWAMGVYAPSEDDELFSPRAVITTRFGKIEIALDVVETPLTTASFVRLARSGFYNGLTFHRVVPGFVVQGGDPRGDGFGGPGYTLRCENNMKPYDRGSVGMALAGVDTGGSQFFIALGPQPHLDGSYTHFGRVIAGMDVVDQLQPGDVMERVDVFLGDEPHD